MAAYVSVISDPKIILTDEPSTTAEDSQQQTPIDVRVLFEQWNRGVACDFSRTVTFAEAQQAIDEKDKRMADEIFRVRHIPLLAQLFEDRRTERRKSEEESIIVHFGASPPNPLKKK